MRKAGYLARSMAAAVLAASAVANATAAPEDDDGERADSICPRQLHRRSADQVLQAHFAAFRSANAQLLACDYAKKAVFILPGSVARGRDQIAATFAGFFQSAGPVNSLTLTTQTTGDGAALVTYTLDTRHIVVTDGVDTFVVENGRIVLQTAYLGGLSVR